MFCYRFTKYNPLFRDKKGHYTNSGEWTEFMGYHSSYPDFIEYHLYESAYICFAISLILQEKNTLYKLILQEKNNLPVPDSALETNISTLEYILRKIIRKNENYWSIVKTDSYYLTFTNDLYGYIYSKNKIIESEFLYSTIKIYIEEIDKFPWQDNLLQLKKIK